MGRDFLLAEPARRGLRVFYPAGDHRLVLRTEDDWDQDLEPLAVTDDGTCHRFEIASRRPALYFKACLYPRGKPLVWEPGANSLLLMTEPEVRPMYPHFFTPPVGHTTDLITFPSRFLNREHRLRVYLPRGYAENTLRHYRVLYTQDGQNLFFPEEAFLGHDWGVNRTVTLLDQMNAVENAIIVGIWSADRMEEYTYPGYEAYGKALLEEIQPYVEANFRTLTGKRSSAVMGSSLGGVVSFYLGWEYPESFHGVIAMSSTFTYKDNLLERVLSEPYRKARFYLDSGWPGDNYEVTLAMASALIRRGWVVGKDLMHLAFPLSEHDEESWGMRLHIPAQLFAGTPFLQSRRAANLTQPMPKGLLRQGLAAGLVGEGQEE